MTGQKKSFKNPLTNPTGYAIITMSTGEGKPHKPERD
jgi:hypothetical protein